MINISLQQGQERTDGNHELPRLMVPDNTAWLSNALKRTRFGLWKLDLAKGETLWTENIFQMFGQMARETSVDPEFFQRMVHPDDREHCRLAMQRCIETGADYHARFRVVRSDGSIAWIESTGQLVTDSQGTPIAIEGGAAEITDQVQAEQELASTHAAYQKAVASAGMVVYQYDFASDNYSNINLAELEEMFGKPYLGSHKEFHKTVDVIEFQLLGELAGNDFTTAAKRFQGGEVATWRTELSFRLPNGRVRWIYDNAYLMRDEQGKPYGTFGMLQDITELKLLSASVEQIVEQTGASDRDYLQQLAAALGNTLNARYVEVAILHPATVESVALVIDAEVRQNVFVPLRGTPYECFLSNNVCVFDESIKDNWPSFEMLQSLDIRAGLGVALKSRAGETIGALLLLHDNPIDDSLDSIRLLRLFASHAASELERRQSAEELNQLNQSLEELVEERTSALQQANRELESFAYSVSHDLRQPLRAIDGFTRILDMDYGDRLDAEAKQHIGTIRAATRRMSNLIDDLLRLSRLISHEIHRREIDLTKLAQESLESLHATQSRPHTFTVEEGLTAIGDESLLRAVLDNLIQNAWKFTVRTEHVEITVGKIDGAFFVKDNGVGFDMKYVNKLFEPFQRLHVRDDFEGTGIGLATVKRIIERHKGRAWADSKLGEGTTIYFTLPEK